MKIITLVPVKNESWILHFSLKNFSIFSDEIIILDDNSSDELREIAKGYPKVKIAPFKTAEEHVDMSLRRNILLNEGRNSGGTHFVFLDADETFSDSFANNFREKIASAQKGETLYLPWIFVMQDGKDLCFNSKEKLFYKDFIFYDDGVSIYRKQFLSEERTPGNHDHKRYFPFKTGYVLHFQKLAQKRNQLKQAWYRCNELIEGTRSARRINATYRHSKETVALDKELLQDAFVTLHFDTINQNTSYEFYIHQITALFEQKTISFFEPLDIWDIPELRELFIGKIGMEPKPRVFPNWLLSLNDLKNKVKNAIL